MASKTDQREGILPFSRKPPSAVYVICQYNCASISTLSSTLSPTSSTLSSTSFMIITCILFRFMVSVNGLVPVRHLTKTFASGKTEKMVYQVMIVDDDGGDDDANCHDGDADCHDGDH